MSEAATKFTVSGRVQGVFYRASTAERAAELGLNGWARNLADGRVEVVVAGPPEAIETMAGWLWQGPPEASVTAVTLEQCEQTVAPGFRIAR